MNNCQLQCTQEILVKIVGKSAPSKRATALAQCLQNTLNSFRHSLVGEHIHICVTPHLVGKAVPTFSKRGNLVISCNLRGPGKEKLKPLCPLRGTPWNIPFLWPFGIQLLGNERGVLEQAQRVLLLPIGWDDSRGVHRYRLHTEIAYKFSLQSVVKTCSPRC